MHVTEFPKRLLISLRRVFRLLLVLSACTLVLGRSALPPSDLNESVRAFTRLIEFDFVSWTLEALSVKIRETALGTATYISGSERSELVLAYLELVDHIRDVENRIDAIFSDPNVQDPMADSRSLRTELNELKARQAQLGQLAESTLQHQLSQTLAELGLAFGGQSIPPVLYRTTPLPSVLIVSPRDTIRQAANISLHPDLTIDERESLEDQVDQDLNVSSLVVSVGGIGLYPSMVIGTSDINTLSEIVAHEWIHNFLTLRPLGINVFASAELLTMNETTANIAGKEISRALVAQHYPEFRRSLKNRPLRHRNPNWNLSRPHSTSAPRCVSPASPSTSS